MNEVTIQQGDFAAHYVANGGNGAQAAISAGYAEASSRQAAYKLLKLPHVQSAIRAEQRVVLTELMSIGLDRLRTILKSDDTKSATIVDAVIKIADRAGLAPKSDTDPLGQSKPLDGMTIAELEEFIRHRESELRDITPSPAALPAPKLAG